MWLGQLLGNCLRQGLPGHGWGSPSDFALSGLAFLVLLEPSVGGGFGIVEVALGLLWRQSWPRRGSPDVLTFPHCYYFEVDWLDMYVGPATDGVGHEWMKVTVIGSGLMVGLDCSSWLAGLDFDPFLANSDAVAVDFSGVGLMGEMLLPFAA
ncbi:hypothetical protein Nepgr_013472 [Nepenthes gracilis]|uniref:Uncharacterized protein n=1 Tax=Nepenthes gracilis TaxID=150966 RepID=A0AAD3SJ71_NEPGR|nr:hypothetical protein Nepgr_013472 [Nepenthes gracilis]